MNDQEKALIKAFGHDVVDKFLPEFIAAEEARLPDTYAGIVQMVLGGLVPKFQEFLDAKIDGIGA